MIRRVLLAAAVVILGLAAAEGVLHLLDWPRFDACDATPPWAVGDPELGYRGDPGRPVAGVTPNALGLRGPVPRMPKPPGELRLLFLGDSSCWGLGVDLSQTFAARVVEHLGPQASYVLGAFPGYSSHHSAILLERLLPYAPDVAILYVGARNDPDRARYYPDADIPARRDRLSSDWHQVRVLRAAEGAVDRLTRLARRLRARERQARVPPEAFRANLQAMLERLRTAGVVPLLVLPPVSESFAHEQPLAPRYRALLVEVAEAEGVSTVSVDEAFARHASDAPLFFPDGFHLERAGHRLVAEAIDSALLREGFGTRSP